MPASCTLRRSSILWKQQANQTTQMGYRERRAEQFVLFSRVHSPLPGMVLTRIPHPGSAHLDDLMLYMPWRSSPVPAVGEHLHARRRGLR